MSDLFATTHWTRVRAARGNSDDARQALSDLCSTYYTPVLTFLRHSTPDEDHARDLAHAFFAQILERHGLEGAAPHLGRFRTYLLGAVKHFLANHRASALRAKRGGTAPHQPLLVGTDSSPGLDIADPRATPDDVIFDREWAVLILQRALDALAAEAGNEKNERQFALLKPWLLGHRPDHSSAQVAQELGMTEGAVRVAIHRLRRRFRELVKGEIAQTMDTEGTVEEELNHLITVLSRSE